MTAHLQADIAIECHDSIGEGPMWDARKNRLLWFDHALGTVHETIVDQSGYWFEVRRHALGRPIAAVVPRSNGGLLVASGTEIYTWDEDSDLAPFTALTGEAPALRINDAKCDRQGRLWAGTLHRDFLPDAAALHRVDPDGTVHTVLEGVTLANGLDWSPDGSTFYFVDSARASVDRFDFKATQGTISNRRRLIEFARGEGIPNGMSVDREGCLWIALTGAGEVRRYNPEGQLLAKVSISTPGATSCAFGGLEGEYLFITSRSGRMPEVALRLGLTADMMDATGPTAGSLFVYRPGVTGAPANRFAG
jgi:sugar lactone lactonase YvrE